MTLLVRRVVLPLIVIIAVLCCAVAGAAVLEVSRQTIVWVTVAAGILATVASAIVIKLYARAQGLEILGAFQAVIPRNSAGIVLFDPPRDVDGIDETLASLAKLFGTMLRDAAQDHAQLMTIISSMSEGLVAVDRQQRILLANRAAETVLGISLADAKGKPLWEQVTVEGVAAATSEVMLTGRPKTVTVGPRNGRYMDIRVSRLPASAGLVIVAHDITEATRYQRLREEFVANVSHELRTPLSVIKGFVETLLDGAIDDRERAIRYLQTVANHTEQLTNLVNDILDLSRLEGRGVAVKKDRVDVAELIRHVHDLMLPAAEKKGQKLIVEVGDRVPIVLGSAENLGRAIANLVDNAIKYTREGGEIRLSAQPEGASVMIRVHDNGIGISDDDLPRIFERFYRSDQSRSREMGGTGLGLSIVKHIVQGHDGTIDVASRLGAGSTFTIHIPASS